VRARRALARELDGEHLTCGKDPRSMDWLATPRNLLRLIGDSSGATAVEYALIVSAIAGLIATVVYVLGSKTNNIYNNVSKGW
jgi:Flp pilus assembly pilin Flp